MLREARRLMTNQSGRIQPSSLRESFLRNSRVNREIQAMWVRLGLSNE
jgi:hypothetical protein